VVGRTWRAVVRVAFSISIAAIAVSCSDKSDQSSGAGPADVVPTPQLLDQTLASYGNCLADHFDVKLQYRVDRFSGIQMSLLPIDGQPVSPADAAQGDVWISDCEKQTDVDAVSNLYLQAFPLSDSQNTAISDEFRICSEPLIPGYAERLTRVRSRDDILVFQSELAGADTTSATLVEPCAGLAIYGPVVEFGSSDA